MKIIYTTILLISVTICVYSQVGIGTTTPSGALEVTSTNDGLLIPRIALTNTITTTVITPTKSELIYNTATAGDVTPGYYYWETTPTVASNRWVRLITNLNTTNWSVTGNTGTNPTTNFAGTTDNIGYAIRTNNTEKIRITPTGAIGIGTTAPNGALDINSTTQGLVPPRVALTASNIAAPVVNPQGGALIAGTFVWNTATAGTSPNNVAPGLYFWNGSRWIALAGSAGGLDWSLQGNSGTIAGTNFLGTIDTQDLQLNTNNLERVRILSGGTVGINSPGATFSQVTVVGAGTNDAVAGNANDNVANAFWGRNANATGTAIIGASNGINGVFPTKGAGVAGSAVNGIGVYGSTGNGSPNNATHNGNFAASFNLDTDNNATTSNNSAFANLAGKDEQVVGALGAPSRRILYGGYFVGGTSSAGISYSYVGLKYNHNNDATATGGTNYKIVGNGVVSTLIPDENNEPRIMFCPEAPEVLFEDYGIGQLNNGTSYIELDKIVSKSLKIDTKHPLKVFIQLEGECNGVYVTEKSEKGFKVKELNNGTSNVSFSWHITGNRADSVDANGNITSYYQDLRLPYGPKPLSEPKLSSKEEKQND